MSGQQRWLGPAERALSTDGVVTEFPLPNPGSGPTTIALTQDGSVWFTESAGNRIGRMRPDGTGLTEFPLPNPNSSPRIIALGSDGNLWFSEHTGNRMGRITPARHHHRVRNSHTERVAARDCAWRRRQHLVRGVWRAGRSERSRRRASSPSIRFPPPTAGHAPWPPAPTATSGSPSSTPARSGGLRRPASSPSFRLPRPNSGPGDITAGADGHMWFVELSGTMDGRKPDGNRVGRITLYG